MRSLARVVLFFSGLLFLVLASAGHVAAQERCYFTVHGRGTSEPMSPSACRSHWETAIGLGYSVGPCVCHSVTHSSADKPKGPSASDEVEKEHEAWLRRQREAKEKAKNEAEKLKEFNEDKNKALHSMKGIYVNNDELKGIGDAGSSGLRGLGGLGSSELKSATGTGGSALKPASRSRAEAAAHMAAVCNRRAVLARRQAELAQDVPTEEFAIRDLQQEFQKAAANSEYWGSLYGSVHKDDERISWALDKLDPLTAALKHARVPNPEAPTEAEGLPFGLNELDEYVQIARVAAQSADAITGFVASGKVHGIDQKTLGNLKALRGLSNRLGEHLVALRRVNKGLAALPACDSTELVK